MKDTFYFPHDSNAKDDPKIMMLIAQLGLEAYGIYWIIIETLRNQPEYKLPLLILRPLAMRYGTSEEKMRTIVEKFDLFEMDGDLFFSPSLMRRMEIFDEKKKKALKAANARWKKEKTGDENANAMQMHYGRNTDALQTQSDRNAIKLNKIKLNEIKLKDKEKLNKKKKASASLMRNASITLQDVIDDFQKREDLKLADAEFYFNVTLDWSNSKSVKRSDWLSQVRNIARRDISDGKLKTTGNKKLKPWER